MNPALEVEVKDIARREAAALLRQHGIDVRQHVLEAILPAVQAEAARQVAAQIPATPVLEVHTGRRRRTKRIRGPYHHLLPQIIKMASSRSHDGFPLALWLYGPPGTGKSFIAKQVAEALGASYYLVPLGPTSTESKLVGFQNLVNGQFVPGLLCEPFKNSGLAFLDEVDVADPGVLVGINALISNDRFRFPDGAVVERHRDFYLLAGGNTIGTGGTSGFTRNKLDAAFLDRFVKVKVDYDPQLESALCDNDAWVSYVQKVRLHLQRSTLGTFYVTSRAVINGAALLEAGIPASVVVESVLLPGCTDAIRRDIKIKIGEFKA